MKFRIKKICLVDILKKATAVSKNGIKSDFDLADRVFFEVDKDKDQVQITATNGHLDFRTIISKSDENGLEITESGQVEVTSSAALQVASAMGGTNPDTLFDLDVEGEMMRFALAGKKRRANIQTLKHVRDIKTPKVQKPLLSHTFPADLYHKPIRKVSPFITKQGYKVHYQMICLHFLKDDVRIVCGNGSRFGVYSLHTPSEVDGDEKRLLIPAEQAKIISSVTEDASEITFIFKDEQTCRIESDNGIEMYLRGIADVQYIKYENHAFRKGEASYIVDASMIAFSEAVGTVGVVKDKELEKEGDIRSAYLDLDVNKQQLSFIVDERKYKCDLEWEAPEVAVYKKESTAADQFRSSYAHTFLDDAVKATEHETVRFYVVGDVIIAEPISFNEKLPADEDGVPTPDKSIDGTEFVIFFGSVKEKDS